MNIIILGAGKVGYNIAKQLIHEKKHVTIIEKDSLKVKQVSNQLDCIVINIVILQIYSKCKEE